MAGNNSELTLRRLIAACFTLTFSFVAAFPAAADVIVLANRTIGPLDLQIKPVAGSAFNLKLASRDLAPLFLDGRAHVAFTIAGEPKQYLMDANSVYYFGQAKDGTIDLRKIGLGEDATTVEGRELPGQAISATSAVIPVKILVDDDEPAKQHVWERRLRQRVEAASAVLNKYCRVQLKVVAVDKWDTDDATTDFFASLSEFEREVKPFPARVTIGFTSQYQVTQGRVHMAGTRGPLHTHILVREWGRQMTEPERLELLVHELGHFLGASHSPEQDSVMRPVLGNRQAVRAGFQVRFDPVNTLVMGMVGEELRRRRIDRVVEMTPDSKRRLRQIYQALAPTMPQDPATQHFILLLDAVRPTR